MKASMRWVYLLTALAMPSAAFGQAACAVASMGVNVCEDCFCGDCDSAAERDAWSPNIDLPMVIRVRFVLIATSLGGLPTSTQVNNQLEELNDAFENYGIQFERGDADTFDVDARYGHFCGTGAGQMQDCWCLDYDLDCLSHLDLPEAEERALKDEYADITDSMLNIFVTGMGNTGGTVGRGYYPWNNFPYSNLGGVVLDRTYFGGASDCDSASCRLLVHEIGHALGLWHTFQFSCEDECISCDGSCEDLTCNTTGDLCCDTAFSVGGGLSSCSEHTEGVPNQCSENGYYSVADYTNYMDYADAGCWDHFTPQQARRMHCWACNAVPGWIDSPDCNSNDIPDICEITRGDKDDCDANGVPDDCQPDCNSNFVADVCDIAEEVSDDCDGNGVPDECHSSTQQRACCHDGDQCTVMTELCCDELSGVFVEEASTCLYGPCAMFGP